VGRSEATSRQRNSERRSRANLVFPSLNFALSSSPRILNPSGRRFVSLLSARSSQLQGTGYEGDAEIIQFLKNRSPFSLATLNQEFNVMKLELAKAKQKQREEKEREEVRGGEERSDEPTTQFQAALAC